MQDKIVHKKHLLVLWKCNKVKILGSNRVTDQTSIGGEIKNRVNG
jgi:hypothetical protein